MFGLGRAEDVLGVAAVTRNVVAGMASGLIAGLLTGAFGALTAMRIVAATAGEHQFGFSGGSGLDLYAGEFTFDATMEMVLLGGAAGTLFGLIFVAVRPWLLGLGRWIGVGFGLLLVSLFGWAVVEADKYNFGLATVTQHRLCLNGAVGLFPAAVLVAGLIALPVYCLSEEQERTTSATLGVMALIAYLLVLVPVASRLGHRARLGRLQTPRAAVLAATLAIPTVVGVGLDVHAGLELVLWSEHRVRQTFESYRQALTVRDGGRGADLVDAATLRHYNRLRELALTGNEAEVRQLDPVGKVIVLTLRHQMEAADLQRMTGRDVFAHGINEGWVLGWVGNAAGLELGHVLVEDDSAGAIVYDTTTREDFGYSFFSMGLSKERWGWRISLFDHDHGSLNADRKLRGIQEVWCCGDGGDPGDYDAAGGDDALIDMLEVQSGRRPPPGIWQPSLREP